VEVVAREIGVGARTLERWREQAQSRPDRGAITANGFEVQARRTAKLMREQFNLGFIDVGGWDTHVGEGGASGYLATRLGEFARGGSIFAHEMGPAWRNTVVVVVSEFGRTFRENGNRGTDLGHGSAHCVLGGGIRGRQIAGDQIKVDRSTLFQDRDYPVINEYHSLFGGLFMRMYGLNPSKVERVFPQFGPKDLGLISRFAFKLIGLRRHLAPAGWAFFDVRIITLWDVAVMPVVCFPRCHSAPFDIDRWCGRSDAYWRKIRRRIK